MGNSPPVNENLAFKVLKKEAHPETREDHFVALNRLATGLHGDYPLGDRVPSEKEAQLYLRLAAVTAGFAPQIASTWVDNVLAGASLREREQFAIMQSLAQFVRAYVLNTAEVDRTAFAQSHVARRKLAKTLPPQEERLMNLFLENPKGFAPFLLASAVECQTLVKSTAVPATLVKTFTDPIALPTNPAAFHQPYSGYACDLFSLLAAALQKPEMRKMIDTMLVYQDETHAYFKFPDFPKEQVIQKLRDSLNDPVEIIEGVSEKMLKDAREREVALITQNLVDFVIPSALIYKVKKDIHTSRLLPTQDPWVNLFAKAYFEYIFKIKNDKD